MKRIKLGTRGSDLALWQAHYVERLLKDNGYDVELVVITTTGDVHGSGPIIRLGAQGVFSKEIERALLAGEIDLAVHSLKDLPTDPVSGLLLAGTPVRGPVEDVFISNTYKKVKDLPEGAKVGTGSLRRKTQLLYQYKRAFCVEDIRGNVETRLAKLDRGEYDAIILAAAGLERLGLSQRVTCRLQVPEFLPAPGQGAIALETREGDEETNDAVATINDQATFLSVLAERSFLLTLQGGCIAPIAACARFDDSTLTLLGRVISLDAKQMYETKVAGEIARNASRAEQQEEAVKMGRAAAEQLLHNGADEVVAAVQALRERSGV
ncbi:MAG: hydroxymethylbilane synthase [Planctomycetia bacterium]|nr:hydroxymethylbilane synthase [Planctomycetia bacterium]